MIGQSPWASWAIALATTLMCNISLGNAAPLNRDLTTSLTSKTQVAVPGQGPVPRGRVPRFAETLEANALGGLSGSPADGVPLHSWSLRADLSLLGAVAGGFRGPPPPRPRDRRRVWVGMNELFATVTPVAPWDLTLGKRRNGWGPAYAFNPLDTLYPSKNPLDPSQQKQGIWLTQTNVLLGPLTLSALFSPEVVESGDGLPQKVGVFSRSPGEPRQSHTVGVLRAHLLGDFWETNFVYSRRNRYLNPYIGHQWGTSVSVQWAKNHQFHLEATAQRGSPRPRPLGRVPYPSSNPSWGSRLNERTLYTTAVMGWRWQSPEDRTFVVEWLHQGDGWTRPDFNRFYDMLGAPGVENPRGVEGLTMRNYLLGSMQRLKLGDEVYGGVALVHNLQDGSGAINGQVQWSRWDSLSIATALSWNYMATFEPFKVRAAPGSKEFGLAPTLFQGALDVKYFF